MKRYEKTEKTDPKIALFPFPISRCGIRESVELFLSAVAGEGDIDDLIILFDRNAHFFGKDLAREVFDFVDFKVGVQGRIGLNLVSGLFGGGVDLNDLFSGSNVGFEFPVDNTASVVLPLSVGGLENEGAGVDGFPGDGDRTGNVNFFRTFIASGREANARDDRDEGDQNVVFHMKISLKSLNVNRRQNADVLRRFAVEVN